MIIDIIERILAWAYSVFIHVFRHVWNVCFHREAVSLQGKRIHWGEQNCSEMMGRERKGRWLWMPPGITLRLRWSQCGKQLVPEACVPCSLRASAYAGAAALVQELLRVLVSGKQALVSFAQIWGGFTVAQAPFVSVHSSRISRQQQETTALYLGGIWGDIEINFRDGW